MLQELKQRGFDTSKISDTDWIQSILEEAKRQIDSKAVPFDFSKLRRVFYDLLDDFEVASVRKAKLMKDTKSTLARLKSANVRMACLTNSGRPAVDYLLNKHALLPYFEFVLSRDETPTMKPRPQGVQKAIDMFQVSKNEMLYVGDSVADIEAGRAAGVQVASIATGSSSLEKLKDAGSDYVLKMMGELTGLVVNSHHPKGYERPKY